MHDGEPMYVPESLPIASDLQETLLQDLNTQDIVHSVGVQELLHREGQVLSTTTSVQEPQKTEHVSEESEAFEYVENKTSLMILSCTKGRWPYFGFIYRNISSLLYCFNVLYI